MKARSSVQLRAAALVLAATGCALTSKGEPLQIRYFTPESSAGSERGREAQASSRTAVPAGQEPLGLALGRIRASAHLRERIAFRTSANELGFYDTRRWTERPESYLRRALASDLFEQRGIEPLVGGPGATLDVELVAFEEARTPRHVARMQVVYLLYGGGAPAVERTITVERPIANTKDPPAGVVTALAAALDEGVARIADAVVAQLEVEAQRSRGAADALGPPCPTPPSSWSSDTPVSER